MDNKKKSNWDTDRYLARIGMERREPLTREYLDQLVTQHLIHVPFENLDVYKNRVRISQDLEELYDKIVVRHRGGYCFELNKMFQALLKSLGFHTYPCFCRVQMGDPVSHPILHRGNIVYLDGKQLFCDVGFGNAMSRGALELKEGLRQMRGTDEFWFQRYNDYWWDMYRKPQDLIHEDGTKVLGEARLELRVNISSAEEIDFILPNEQTQSSDARFAKVIAVGRLTENGALSLTDEQFSIIEGNRKTRRNWSGEEELKELLDKYFGIVL